MRNALVRKDGENSNFSLDRREFVRAGLALAATANVKLSETDVQDIETGFAKLTIQGARSSEAVLALIDVGARLGTSSTGGHGISPLRKGNNL